MHPDFAKSSIRCLKSFAKWTKLQPFRSAKTEDKASVSLRNIVKKRDGFGFYETMMRQYPQNSMEPWNSESFRSL